MTHSIDSKELNRRLSIGEPVTLLDVRRKADYEADPKRIPNSFWRDPEKIDKWFSQLPSDTFTVVYCVKGGSVSQAVTDQLRREGLETVFLQGGFKNWIADGQPVEPIHDLPEERIIIYADRLVDIITNGIVPIKEEKEAEERFEEILQTIPKYGKNAKTLKRFLGYHREIQGLSIGP